MTKKVYARPRLRKFLFKYHSNFRKYVYLSFFILAWATVFQQGNNPEASTIAPALIVALEMSSYFFLLVLGNKVLKTTIFKDPKDIEPWLPCGIKYRGGE